MSVPLSGAAGTSYASNANTPDPRVEEWFRDACKTGDIETIEHVIATEHNGDMEPFLDLLADGLAGGILVKAAVRGKVELVHAIAARYPDVVNERFYRPGFRDMKKFSPLEAACYSDRTDVAFALLDECGADVNLEGGTYPPLFMACKNGNERLARALLEKDADVSLKGMWEGKESSPFAVACEWGRLECARLLMEFGGSQIDVTEFSLRDRETPISMACLNGHLEVVRYLHEDLVLAIPGECGVLHKPLLERVWEGRGPTELIQYLIKKGVKMDAAKATSEYVLQDNGRPSVDPACLQALFESGQIPSNLFSLALSVPFYEDNGAEGRYNEVCEMLKPYVSEIAWATFIGFEEIVDTLLNTEDPNRVTPFGTLIEIAALLGEDRVIDLLVERGANPNPDCETSPLKLAVRDRHLGAILSLIRAGANTEEILEMGDVAKFVFRYLAQTGQLRVKGVPVEVREEVPEYVLVEVREDDPLRELLVLPAGSEIPSLYEMARRVVEFQDEGEVATVMWHFNGGD